MNNSPFYNKSMMKIFYKQDSEVEVYNENAGIKYDMIKLSFCD